MTHRDDDTFSGQVHRGVIADERRDWLDAAERVLEGLGIDVVGKETSTGAALSLIQHRRPDLLVVHIRGAKSERGGAGLECLRLVRERRLAELKAIVFGDSADRGDINAAFTAGADVYVLGTAGLEDVAAGIRQAFTQSAHFRRGPDDPSGRTAALRPQPRLTSREREVLQLIAEGHTNAQVARMLWVTEQTVKFHLSNIYRKLNLSNRTEASRWAQLHALLSAPSS